MRMLVSAICIALLGAATGAEGQANDARMTRWGQSLDPENVHPEHPRPMLVRHPWRSLNGEWNYAVLPAGEGPPSQPDGTILVPFPIESALSGVERRVESGEELWYQKTIPVPTDWSSGRVWLHFGAVDWKTTVYLNGLKVGEHEGGYNPFSFDITNMMYDRPTQDLVVIVSDPTNEGEQPRGKQVREPGGIWYTPVTGIWQSVWIESAPWRSIEDLDYHFDRDQGRLVVESTVRNAIEGMTWRVEALADGEVVAAGEGAVGDAVALEFEAPRLWSPDDPFLYDIRATLHEDDKVVDEVASYTGLRTVELGPDSEGRTRILLNGEPVFQIGLLDQGYWPDGLYTAPSDEALRYDIEVTKELGFNMARKHVKIEPQRWYYWADRLGLLVWQDMPSGGPYIGPHDDDAERSDESAAQFEAELRELVDDFRDHPSIVMWVLFNEGWGQYDTQRLTEWLEAYDSTRLVNSASGWADRGVGDVHDWHRYPGPDSPEPERDRAAVLGEFGGLGLVVEDHLWQTERNWGYRSYETSEELTDAYVELLERVHRLIGDPGLSAAVYTQTTDVEIEVNGVMTYDRAVIKLDPERVRNANHQLHTPPPIVRPVVPSSRDDPQEWRYTTEPPNEDWHREDFDDSLWKTGPGGFGRAETPGAVVRTEWTTQDIWLRQTVMMFEVPEGDIRLLVHHDEDATIYINGVLAAELEGYTTSYVDVPIRPEAREALRVGKNMFAVHCRQTGGGQYIDLGLVRVIQPSNK
ncbi:MAG: glycoside hydrolase family 2 protein [Phycisphaerales bacterium]